MPIPEPAREFEYQVAIAPPVQIEQHWQRTGWSWQAHNHGNGKLKGSVERSV